MRNWVVAGVVALGLLSGCGRGRTSATVSEPFLLVWAGDADRQQPDFLALIDADASSKTYGKVLKTYPVRSRGNEPQGVSLELRNDRRVFASGVLTNRVFTFDLAKAPAATLARTDEGSGRKLWAPHEIASLPDGRVAVACSDPAGFRGEPRELLASPGGLLVLSRNGELVREISARDPGAPGMIVAPYGVAAAPALDRLVTTNNAHGYAATTRGERMPGISVQVWRLSDLKLLRTVVLDAGPRGEENLGPLAPRVLHRQPFVLVNTDVGGGLYASDSLGIPDPSFRLVFDFGAGARPGGAAVTPDDRWYVTALGGRNRVVALDLRDPWKPTAASAVRLDRDPSAPARARAGGPHALAMSADGSRVAVSDYTMDTPGYARDGDRRVYLVRLDGATGGLRLDDAFRDETTGEVGIDFNRTHWPHGDTGAARPAGLVFVAPAPPPED
jgi:hypothetical protein